MAFPFSLPRSHLPAWQYANGNLCQTRYVPLFMVFPVFTLFVLDNETIEPPRVFHQSEDVANVFRKGCFYEMTCGKSYERGDDNACLC